MAYDPGRRPSMHVMTVDPGRRPSLPLRRTGPGKEGRRTMSDASPLEKIGAAFGSGDPGMVRAALNAIARHRLAAAAPLLQAFLRDEKDAELRYLANKVLNFLVNGLPKETGASAPVADEPETSSAVFREVSDSVKAVAGGTPLASPDPKTRLKAVMLLVQKPQTAAVEALCAPRRNGRRLLRALGPSHGHGPFRRQGTPPLGGAAFPRGSPSPGPGQRGRSPREPAGPSRGPLPGEDGLRHGPSHTGQRRGGPAEVQQGQGLEDPSGHGRVGPGLDARQRRLRPGTAQGSTGSLPPGPPPEGSLRNGDPQGPGPPSRSWPTRATRRPSSSSRR